MIYLRLFCRGLIIVTLVALNTRMIAALSYQSAFVTGTMLSIVWWGNSQTAAHSRTHGARWAYGLGAGVGTALGMWLGR